MGMKPKSKRRKPKRRRRSNVTVQTPLTKEWTSLPKILQFPVKAKAYWIRHGVMPEGVGTVIGARKKGKDDASVFVRVQFPNMPFIVEDRLNMFTKAPQRL